MSWGKKKNKFELDFDLKSVAKVNELIFIFDFFSDYAN